MLKQNQNQFFGISSSLPSKLTPGSVFFDIEKIEIYIYDLSGTPRLFKSVPESTPSSTIKKIIGLASQSNGLPTTEGSATTQTFSFPSDTYQIGRLNGNDNLLIAASSPLDHSDQVNAEINGYDVQLAISRRADNPDDQIIFVPASVGATGYINNRWGVGNDLYDDFVARMLKAKELEPTAEYEAIIVIRGEQDYTNQSFLASFNAEIDGWRTALGDQTIPIVFVTATNRFHEQNPTMGANVTKNLLDVSNRKNYTSVFDTRIGVVQSQRVSAVHYSEMQQDEIMVGIRLAIARAKLNTNAIGNAKTTTPSNLAAVKNGANIDVSWNAVSGAYDYWLEYSLNGGQFMHIALPDGTDNGLRTGNSYSFSDLPLNGLSSHTPIEGDVINFRVAASTLDNTSDYSTEVSVIFSDEIYDEWIFGSDNILNSNVGGSPLTLIGSAPVLISAGTPTGVTENAIDLLTTDYNGLVSPYETGTKYTMCAVIGPNEGANRVIIGTYINPTPAGDHVGSMLYNNNTNSLRGLAGGNPFNGFTLSEMPSTGYTFVALTVSEDGTSTAFIGLQTGNITRTDPGLGETQDLTDRKIAIGNAYFASSYFNSHKYAGFITINNDKNLTELDVIYENFRAKLLTRGLVVN